VSGQPVLYLPVEMLTQAKTDLSRLRQKTDAESTSRIVALFLLDGHKSLESKGRVLLESLNVMEVKPSSSSNYRHRILLVDGMEIVRIGLAKVISAASQLVVCAATGDYDEVEDLIERHRPHSIIAEPFHENRDGIMWIKELCAGFPDTKV
jgi:hypothetical protein